MKLKVALVIFQKNNQQLSDIDNWRSYRKYISPCKNTYWNLKWNFQMLFIMNIFWINKNGIVNVVIITE